MSASAGQDGPAEDLMVLLHERADAVPPVRLTLAERMRVAFSGSRGGEGPVTIAQRTALTWVTNSMIPTRMVEWPLSLPPGTTLADIAAALQVIMARHEVLRTCYPPVPGEPVQRVIQSGELVVDLYAADSEPADDAVLVTGLTGLLRARDFDLATELPVRVAVALWHDTPRAIVALFSHAAADMAAMVQLDREFTILVTDPSSREAGPPRLQPLDLAADEQSPQGRRRHDAAVRGWEAAFQAMPQCLFAVPSADPRRDGGVVSGWLWSRAGALALAPITARTGASRQLVVLAALSAMIGWRTGHETCVFPVLVSNRYRRSLREYIGCLAQDGILSLDVRAGSFDEVVRRAGTAMVRCNRSSLVTPQARDRAARLAEHRRGIIWTRHYVYNDISEFQAAADGGQPPAGPDEIRQARGQTRFAQLSVPGKEESLLLVVVSQVDAELIIGGIARDASRVPLGEVETLLRGVESLLVEAASGDVPLSGLGDVTGVAPVDRGPGWLRIGPSWIELAQVQRLVQDALPAAAVFAIPQDGREDRRGEPELVAYLAAGGGVDTPEQAHAACMATLAGTRSVVPPDGIRYTAMTPGRYVICAAAPRDTGDLAGWQQQAVVAEGDGRWE